MCGWAFFEAQLGSCTSALYKPNKARCSDHLEGVARTAIGIRDCYACAFPDPRPFYPRKRTSRSSRWTSAKGHNRTHAPRETGLLFDHLVSTGEKGLRHSKPESPGRFQVDDQGKFGRLLD